MKTCIVLVSEAGYDTARTIKAELGGEIFSLHNEPDTIHINTIGDLLAGNWNTVDCFVFIGAMGICVRSIAPFIADKHTDPAVICVDGTGATVVPVLSGHVGGANEAAIGIASALGVIPAVTTLSDKLGLWALDTIADKFGWTAYPAVMNAQIALFTARKPTALLLTVRDSGTEWMERNLPGHVKLFFREDDIVSDEFDLLIIVGARRPKHISLPFVHYIPRCFHVGIGLAHQAAPAARVCDEILAALASEGIPEAAIADISSIEEKRDEPALALLAGQGYALRFFTAGELKDIDVPNPSETVMKHVGTASVSEAAAVLAAGGGELIMQKKKGADWTVAAAMDAAFMRKGHIEIVGAGPGDPELVSVRGRRMLERADLILYAGSLVPRKLTECAKQGATVRSSASLTLEEQVEIMKEYYDRGKFVVRLHTGDPCLYGAIQEQMNHFDRYGMRYHITPGISAFQAAAAELRSQFTIPRKTQTIILTRGEGRTPMPDTEKLHLLARSRSTMCIYLSADIVENVQEELLREYPADTPVAVCHKLTWPEQRIYKGVLADLAAIVRGNGLRLDTLLVIGEAIDNRHGLSELYSRHFTHLYRKAEE